MPLYIFDKLGGIINNVLHTYSSAYWDDYKRSGVQVGRRANATEEDISDIVCQKKSVGCLCRVDEIYDCFEWPWILGKGYVIQICKRLAMQCLNINEGNTQSCTVKAPYRNKLIALPAN